MRAFSLLATAAALFAPLVVGVVACSEIAETPRNRVPANGSPQSEDARVPYWNMWFEAGNHEEMQFAPVEFLKGSSSYTLQVHLSAVEFEAPGALSTTAGAALLNYLRAAPGDSTELQLLLLTDPRHIRLRVGAPAFVPIRIDTARLWTALASASQHATVDVRDPLFDLGAARFPLSTTGRGGISTIGLSIWADGVPIGELSMTICIEGQAQESCAEQAVSGAATSGSDDVRIANQLSGRGVADAALHFVALDESTMMGVFRCNACGWPEDKFLSWRLKSDKAALVNYLRETILPAFENAAAFDEPKAFEDAGSDLYRTFFYSEAGPPREAKRAFEKFVAAAAANTSTPRSIFVRFVSQKDSPPLYGVPLALMRVPIARGQATFIGPHLRIEIPMDYQDYSGRSACVGSWVLFVPPADIEDTAMQDARAPLKAWIDELRATPGQRRVYEDIGLFRDWLEGDETTDDEPIALTNTAVAIVSHHENNKLFLNSLTKVPNITSSTIGRVFGSPSVAIINACGSAQAGAVDFVTKFNHAGIPTVIATSVEVDAKMAGAVLSGLRASLLAHQSEQAYTFGQALFDTTRALQKQYGPEVFIYSIFGDDRLRLCPARTASPPVSTENPKAPPPDPQVN